jgi:hypothetical protein
MGYTLAHPLLVAEIRWPVVWVLVAYTVEECKTLHLRPCFRTVAYGYANIFYIAGCKGKASPLQAWTGL